MNITKHNGKIAFTCKTEDDASMLLRKMAEAGVKWAGREDINTFNPFGMYGDKEITIEVRENGMLGYGSKKLFEQDGYVVYEFPISYERKFFEALKLTVMCKND